MSSFEPIVVGDRKVYPVAAFNGRLRGYLRRIRDVWVEGEVSELRRNEAWATVFLTLCGEGESRLKVQMQRRRYDQLGFALSDGDRIQVRGELDLYPGRGELVFRAAVIERAGVGDQLAAIERLKQALGAEGLFAESRKRPLPRFPRAIGLLTGSDAAARGDVIVALRARFPATRLVVLETRVQGPKAAARISEGLEAVASHPAVDVVVIARGGGSFEDLLPFSDERVVRAIAAATVPIVSAVGHEQDTPLCDLAADARAATPTAAVRLVVPDATELRSALQRDRERLERASRSRLSHDREQLVGQRGRMAAAAGRALQRDRDSLSRTRARLTAGARAPARAAACRARHPRRGPAGAVAAGHARAGLCDRPCGWRRDPGRRDRRPRRDARGRAAAGRLTTRVEEVLT